MRDRRARYTRRHAGAPPTNYAHRLARVIVLNDGTVIVTLLDAVRIVRERCQGVELAIEQLTAAAKSGDDADIAEATDTLERVLRARRLL